MTYSATITCRQPNGEATTPATVYGTWAVHHTIGSRDKRDWSITQVTTGLAIPQSHTEFLSKDQAIEVARALDEAVGSRRVTNAVGAVILQIIHRVLVKGSPK